MSREWVSKAATAVMVLSATAVLAAGAHRALMDGSVRYSLSRALWTRALPSAPPSSIIQIKPGTRHRELVAVLIATSACASTRNPQFVPSVQGMKDELVRRSAAEGVRLRLVGVALDDRLGDGIAMLDRVGPFNEISVGGNWLNTNAVSYIWRSGQRSRAVPQWVLMEREVSTGPDVIAVSPDRLVEIVSGLDQMRLWVRRSRAEAGRHPAEPPRKA